MQSNEGRETDKCCIIYELIRARPFPSRSFAEKQEVMAMSRPCPPLPNLTTKCSIKQKEIL